VVRATIYLPLIVVSFLLTESNSLKLDRPFLEDIRMPNRVKFFFALVVCAGLMLPNALSAEQISVRYAEGLVHGFLVLQTLEGTTIATGELTQTAVNDRVTDKLIFRFKDGSVHEETTVFSQRDKFQVIKYNLVQKGPAFKRPSEMSIDVPSGQITIRYTDNGKEKILNEHLALPSDVANGIVPTLLKNIQPNAPQTTVSMVVSTPKARLVKLTIFPQGQEPFSAGGLNHNAMQYRLKVEIGGAAGIVAPLIGKQPPDFHVWILGGEAPTFLRSEGPLYDGGPVWRMELISPVWPQRPAANSLKK
jgi:hypothetical protein